MGLHVALNEQKQKFEELSRQCGVQIPNYEYEENLIPEVILEDANEDTLQIQDDIKIEEMQMGEDEVEKNQSFKNTKIIIFVQKILIFTFVKDSLNCSAD